jgi:hypothetical protein
MSWFSLLCRPTMKRRISTAFDLPSDVNLTTLVANATHQIQQFDDFRQINASNTTLGGAPTYKVIYTAAIGDSNLKIMQVWAINNGTSNGNLTLCAVRKETARFQVQELVWAWLSDYL